MTERKRGKRKSVEVWGRNAPKNPVRSGFVLKNRSPYITVADDLRHLVISMWSEASGQELDVLLITKYQLSCIGEVDRPFILWDICIDRSPSLLSCQNRQTSGKLYFVYYPYFKRLGSQFAKLWEMDNWNKDLELVLQAPFKMYLEKNCTVGKISRQYLSFLKHPLNHKTSILCSKLCLKI